MDWSMVLLSQLLVRRTVGGVWVGTDLVARGLLGADSAAQFTQCNRALHEVGEGGLHW